MYNRSGYMLVSVIVSIAILMVALSMATSTFFSASRVTKHAAAFTVAGNFAEGLLEQVRAKPYAAIVSQGVQSGLPKLPGVRCAVAVREIEPGLKEVIVTSSWTEGDVTRSARYSTLVGKGGER